MIPTRLTHQLASQLTRRHFFGRSSTGLGAAVLANLMGTPGMASVTTDPLGSGAALEHLHFAPKAKRVIYLFMSGGPSQMDLWDYKPALNEQNGQELPESVRQGQRLSTMSGNQSSLS